MPRLLVLAITTISGLALAAPYQRSTGGGCCTLIFLGLFVAIYRSGGVDWLRAVGAAALPGIFGWFVWRDRALGAGVRWFALITGLFQVTSVVLGMVAALLLPGVLARLSSAVSAETVQPAAADLSQRPEDVSLGLHPLSTITSDPPGAKVFVNGEARGKTPLETPLAAGERNEVKVELSGYFPATQSGSPNAREHLTFSFTLKTAARLQITTTPPGARVLLGREQVLAKTPGLAEPLELGESELTILLAGYQPLRRVMTLPAGDSALEAVLLPGVKLAVTSTPSEADVFVDGAWLGQTPLEAFVSPKGKHLVEVKKDPYAPATRTFASVAREVSFAARLVDTERVAALNTVARARARYDKVNHALEKLQTKIEQMEFPPASLERQRVAMEQQMEQAVTALEQADAALKAVEEARPQPAPAPEKEE